MILSFLIALGVFLIVFGLAICLVSNSLWLSILAGTIFILVSFGGLWAMIYEAISE